ncbi:uncharacterized protein LOC142760568 [Rhinoderma darwinii]|uniref:uncharacterized protein LOC142760568 n=1 Tax=Rhinoderma darwinii TaxID=43563 RepID=UPI003F67835C
MPRACDVEKLICLVHDRPQLWNTNDEAYHDRTGKEVAWDEVAHSLFGQEWEKSTTRDRKTIVDDVKTRWRSCRDQFRREYGNKGRSGDGASKKRPYIYMKQLMFLKDIMEMRPCSDNLNDTEEEAGHVEAHQVTEQDPVLPLTPDRTQTQAATQLSSQPQLPVDLDNPRTPPARRRRNQVAPAGANVDARVLEPPLKSVLAMTTEQHCHEPPMSLHGKYCNC